MSDIHSINEAINKKAGRKLVPSIVVGLSLLGLIWFSLSVYKELFLVVLATAVVLGIREIVRAFNSRSIAISFPSLSIAAIALLGAAWIDGIAGLAIATAISFPILLIRLLLNGPEGFVGKATATTFTLLYLPFLAGFLILLATPSTGFQRVMTFVVLVGCNDTFGYFVGVLFGKHPLVPTISPKKTWEGLAGSVVFTIIGGCLAFHYIMNMHWWIGIIVGLMIVFTATCGDLIESAMKRDLSLKDMGTLLPGHGGMLDRLDSVVLSAPAMWLALELVKHFL
jgi:phosphatidate cytidylyltransferase